MTASLQEPRRVPGVFGLLGPNGAGKSAAKLMISGEKEGVA